MINWVSRIATVVGVLMAVLMPSSASYAQSASGERLNMPLPPGYVIAHSDGNQTVSLTEYTVEGETVHNWSSLITVVVGQGLGHVSLDYYADAFIGGLKSSCQGGEADQIAEGNANGYDYIVLQSECPNSPASGTPERFWTTLIKGRDAIYSVQYAFRGALTEGQSERALTFLQSVSLCDTDRTDAACPEAE